MNRLIQSLQTRYNPQNIEISWNESKHLFLSECIIPSDTFVLYGHGATLQTNNGELIDLASMTVNCILGQNDPWVNANIIAYLLSGRPSFLTSRLGSEFYYKVAKRILAVTGMKDAVINHRQCNGTDVTELAILAAYKHRNESQYMVVSFNNSYHGQGLTSYLISGLQRQHKFLIKEAPILFLDQPTNASIINGDTPLSQKDRQTLDKLKQVAEKVFAVIIEPIQVNNDVNMPSKAFLKELQEICLKHNIALIYDEVQTGFGWLGAMTAAEQYDVYPNLLALSKALTSGNGPLSALISDKKYQDVVDGTGAKTNGSDFRSLVASNAVIDRLMGIPLQQIPQDIPTVLAEELSTGLLAKFAQKANLLDCYLRNLQMTTQCIGEHLKGTGLIRGVEIVDFKGKFDQEKTKILQKQLLNEGVLVRNSKHTLIFKPPIVTTEQEFEKGFSKINKVFKKYI